MSFAGKTVLITGGASGMGLLSGRCFAKEGANVALVDFDRAALDRAVDEVRAITENVIGCCADVRVYEQVKKAVDDAHEAFGSIDILIPFAGGAEARVLNAPGEFQNLPIEVFDFGLDVNLKGAVYFAHAALKYMAEQNCGVIVFIGSITGEEGSPNNVAYAASKSALMNGVVKSIAQAGAKYNVRSVCVAPGPVLTRAAMANMKTMAGRAAQPQEIVDMIMYLASEKGAFVNGTTLLMDGGRNVMYNKG